MTWIACWFGFPVTCGMVVWNILGSESAEVYESMTIMDHTPKVAYIHFLAQILHFQRVTLWSGYVNILIEHGHSVR